MKIERPSQYLVSNIVDFHFYIFFWFMKQNEVNNSDKFQSPTYVGSLMVCSPLFIVFILIVASYPRLLNNEIT